MVPQRNRIAGANGSTLNLALAGNGDLGDRIRVEVYATDGRGAASDAAAAKVTVANTTPSAGTVSTKPVPAATVDVMRAVPSGFADLDGDTLTYQYQWLINGTPVPGATAQTFNVAGRVQLNDRVDVDVRATDGNGGTSPVARGGQIVTSTNSTPIEGTVSITPATPRTNQVVTAATSGFHDPDGNPLTFEYTWKRNGSTITGATASTLDLSQAGNGDRGDTISVDVRARDPQNHWSDSVPATTTVVTTAPTAGTVTIRPTAPAANDIVSAVATGFADIDGDARQLPVLVDAQRRSRPRRGRPQPRPLRGRRRRGRRRPAGRGQGARRPRRHQPVGAGDDHHRGRQRPPRGLVRLRGGRRHRRHRPVGRQRRPDHRRRPRQQRPLRPRAVLRGQRRTSSTCPRTPSLHLGSAMTLEAWVRPTATTNWRSVIFKEADGGLAYGLYANTDQDVPHVHVGNGGDWGADGTQALDPNAWTHLAATYDGEIVRLYVDGVNVGSKALHGELSDAPGPLTFGANHIWGEHYRGLIDEVRVYNRRLTREEILADMDAPVTAGTPRPPSDTEPDKIGQFAPPVQYPVTPVHLALLSNGKVAMWDGFEAAVNSEHTWDPWTGEFDAVPTGRNLFCAGHITLTDGRLLSAGGHIQAYEGTKDLNLFDPKVASWTRGPDMSVARWYPTATALPDGRVFVASGDTITLGPNPDPNTPVPLINYSDTLPEIYNPATNTWTAMPSASRKMPLYPYLFVLPNGKLFDAGPDRMTRTLDLQTGQWSNVG